RDPQRWTITLARGRTIASAVIERTRTGPEWALASSGGAPQPGATTSAQRGAPGGWVTRGNGVANRRSVAHHRRSARQLLRTGRARRPDAACARRGMARRCRITARTRYRDPHRTRYRPDRPVGRSDAAGSAPRVGGAARDSG